MILVLYLLGIAPVSNFTILPPHPFGLSVSCPCLSGSNYFLPSHNIHAGHFCVLIQSSPRTHLHLLHFPLRHYLTNQPYQLFQSGALPNYNLGGSEDAGECKSITGRSHQPLLTLCVGLIDPTLLIPLQESLRDADGVDSQRIRLFLFRQRADISTLMKTDPPACHAKS